MPKIRKFVGVVKAGQLSQTYRHTYIQTYRGYLIGPSASRGPKSWENLTVDFTHTSEREGVTHTSIISEMYFWNEEFGSKVMDAGVIHLPENLSDHCPVYCKFRVATANKTANELNGSARRPLPS